MGKVVFILIGLIFMAVGVWLCTLGAWQQAVVGFIKGAVVIMLLLIGLGVFVFGLSELRAAPEAPPAQPPAGEGKQ